MQGVVLILFTPDFERVLAFYERLLEMPAARRSEGYAELSWGSVTWGDPDGGGNALLEGGGSARPSAPVGV